MLARNFAPATRTTRLACALRFLRRIGVSIAEIRRKHVTRYLSLRANELAPGTSRAELEMLKDFLETFVPEVLRENPFTGFRLPKGELKRPPVVLSLNAVREFLTQSLRAPRNSKASLSRAIALRNRACLELLYGVGLRASELHAARLVDLNQEDGTFLVRRAKRGPSRFLPVPKTTLAHLVRYVREGRPHLVAKTKEDPGHIFLTNRGRPFGKGRVFMIVWKLARTLASKAHPHAFRRTLATHLVRAGVDLLALKELLGHVRLSTTERYVELDREDLRNAVAFLERASRDE